MEKISKGDVIFIPYPFSNLSGTRNRPALVLTTLDGNDIVLCQITSQERFDTYAIVLGAYDFKKGNLDAKSIVRPNKLFTADKSIAIFKVGSLKEEKLSQVIDKACDILKNQK